MTALLLVMTGCVGAPQSALLLAHFNEHSNSDIIEHHREQAAPVLSHRVNLDNVLFFPQEEYQCGPAALATVLNASLVVVSPDDLVSQVYVPERQGSLQIEMLAAPRRYGRISYQLPPSLDAVLREVQAGRPVLVMQNLALTRFPQWHYAVVVGYDLAQQDIILRSGTIRDYRVSLRVFERTWSRAQHWAVVILQPGELPLQASEDGYFQAVSAYENAGASSQAGAAYRAGLERWPDSQLLGMGYGNLAYRDGDRELAITAYSKVLEHHQDYAAAHNNLAQVMFETGDLQGAEAHARNAVRLGGSFAEIYQRTLDRVLAANAAR
ncbi:MAG: PA2778 family cysteine peptidase [Gammaproteobacteria bacterium]|nr:PA2778 family cysteine peptidase [Gammaproteobacteria bacterium]MDP2347510.1 PA2778 family cysteine peptidase [Gammaproteobacteria bacterium]